MLREWRGDPHPARLAPPGGRAVRRRALVHRSGGRLADLAGRPRRAVRDPSGLTAGRGRPDVVHRAPYAGYDPALRFEPVLEPAPAVRLEVPTAADGTVLFDRIGTVALGDVALGEIGRLDVWWLGGYGGGVFLPLRDGTAGSTTYGGGRYLLDTVKGPTWVATAPAWWSTSTSPTTRRAPTTRAGRVRSRRRTTGRRRRSPPGSSCPRRLVLTG
ncbi:DUF1684 domain-containing protein [Blastococcus brunescens]|uniref:DUF1684 domain-containing protein n=1 Tax=Blastococcus brunescens TaxID=1564165 RepID=A0ABZ1B8W1_9ACTN|nr:DUF1684 domain-containing protein [Blastococcus sp. BMG 8361]WRL66812.1 DUF1684 domain-containing protein [Blastococcus sp. BMG 8361]